jgi:predicted dithiol-disulfide oxidoreductase (DUF899 family)
MKVKSGENMSDSAADIQERINSLHWQIMEDRKKLRELRTQMPEELLEDYALLGPDGAGVKLSDAFGEHDDLIVVHNMGKSCPYCTLWADNYNGAVEHLENRAAFVVVSPDEPATQRKFADGRGWRFRMLSAHGTDFIEDMGFASERGFMPGFSTFRKKEDGTIVRVSHAPFGPGDDFCSVWHFFDLLADGPDGWEPQFSYDS